MSEYITKIKTATGDKQIDYNALANLPSVYTKSEIDSKLSESVSYNKAETLSESTKALFGLTSTGTPDDALALLSRFNNSLGDEHIWMKYEVANGVIVASSSTRTISLSRKGKYYVSDTVISKNNTVSLLDPYETTGDSAQKRYYADTDGAIFYLRGSSSTSSMTNYNGYLVSPGTNKVPGAFIGYVNSLDINRYPKNNAIGDFFYVYLGKIGERTRIVSGSYVGTDTYGKDNPNSLTFDFLPKIVLVSAENTWWFASIPSWKQRDEYTTYNAIKYPNYANQAQLHTKWEGNTLYWYCGNTAETQINSSHGFNWYMAIG